MAGPPMKAWPVTLRHGEVTLRPLRQSDRKAWEEARHHSTQWLRPWDATVPPGGEARPYNFADLVRRVRKLARQGTCFPFAVEVDGRFVGQVTVSGIVRGSAQFASIGYWIDQRYAGRGIIPLAVAMAIDHSLTTAGLHRIEIAIRPENTNSLRVVEKLGLHEVGFAPRYLHIDGDWRDHRLYAVTVEQCPGGMVARLG